MSRSIRVYGLTCVLLLLALTAGATTIVMPTDAALVEKAAVIVEGTVVKSAAVDRSGAIWTSTTVNVARTLKGEAAATITVHEIGGTIDDRITKIFGAPEFKSGERVLLFLNPAANGGGYRVVDLFVGKFSREKAADGRELWFRADSEAHVNLLDADFEPLPDANIQRDAARFETFVVDHVAGREGKNNYGIANPVLAEEEGGRFAINPEFTLIDEPTVYRWFSFDSGQTANWYVYGTQPGYSSNGAGEVQTAMNAWTSLTDAKIRYNYAGIRTQAPGGMDRTNGVHEVMLNDPVGDIDGTWNPSTGGVVGVGGFNGVSSGGTFNAPFTADASHPAGSIRAYNITEGNLVIQDGVSPAKGISSNRLAEIISHEFGHTLGFGHSDDRNALMYYTVTGMGPQLREDDRLAARWLYPNGSTNPPPPQAPAAPSNVTATASGANLNVSWSDNSSNETGFSVYLAQGNGSFVKSGNAGANARSATLTGVSAGSYRIYVTAFNGSGESPASNTANVTVFASVQASFSLTPATGTAGVTNFTFYDESSGATSRTWNFGDGSSSTAAVATHVYALPGQYTVTLTAFGAAGAQSTATKTVGVAAPLTADFSWTPANPSTSDTISFRDDSLGGVTSWFWSFGDGSTSTQQNPTKRYTSGGVFNVTLTVARGSATNARTKAVTVVQPNPGTPAVAATFDVSPSTPLVGNSVLFTDRSAGNPTKWQWSFGDGGTSSARNPVHTFNAAGTYLVTLVASNASSSSSATKSVTVTRDIAAYRSLISVTAQTDGVGGSTWRTELTIFNAGDEGISAQLLFIPGAGGAPRTRTLFLAPRQSATYENALLELFGMPSGAGALALEATGTTATPNLKVTSRTFTNGNIGTYGQAVPTVSDANLAQTLYLTGIAVNSNYRTNLGLVNRSATAVNTTLTLVDATGATLATANVTVPANEFQQAALASYFPAIANRTFEVLSMRVSTASGNAVSAYASVVDNRTQDPIYIQAAAAPSGTSLIIPAVGRAQGANGTFWRSDVTIFNPATSSLTTTLRYGSATKNFTIGAGDTLVLDDVLLDLGISAGSGALEMTWSGSNAPVVTSRTFTPSANGGTYGQSIDPVARQANDVYVTGLRSDSSFRTNVGFVNANTNAVSITARLLSANGDQLATATFTLGAKSQVQYSVGSLFPNVNPASIGAFTLHANANSAVFAYGSIVDNGSGDPVFFAGE
ncbi:MAG TPA: PKD domain-containing protein [Thermoanaerobaculia bacterium]